MNKSAIPVKALKLSTDICSDYSIGQNVFAYLENSLPDEETSEFVMHAGECTFCMQTMIKWHYDCVIVEAKNKEAEMTAKPSLQPAFANVLSFDGMPCESDEICPDMNKEDTSGMESTGFFIGFTTKKDIFH